MKEIIEKILGLLSLVLIISILVLVLLYTSEENNISIVKRKIDFYIKEGNLSCNDKIVVLCKNTESLNMKLYNPNDEVNDNSFTINVKANNEVIPVKVDKKGVLNIDLKKLDIKKKNKIKFEIETSYNCNHYVRSYFFGTNILKFSLDGYYALDFKHSSNIETANNIDVSINSDVPINNFDINALGSKFTESDGNYLYSVSIKHLDKQQNHELHVQLDKDTIKTGMIPEENELYDSELNRYVNLSSFPDKSKSKEIKSLIGDIIFLIKLTLILLVISILINIRKTTFKNDKNTDNLASPILAETIIDGKTDLKSLIMSAIIQFHINGNVEIINNKTIKFISYDGLNEYEREIMDLIFCTNLNTITFSQINEIFKKSESDSLNFSKKLASIKRKISDYLYSNKMISKKKTFIANIISLISILIMVNFPTLPFFKNTSSDDSLFIGGMISLCIFNIWLVGTICINYANESTFGVETIKIIPEAKKKGADVQLKVYGTMFIAIAFISGLRTLLGLKLNLILVLVLYAINVLVVYISRSNKLTRYGQKERIKLLKLKNYINEYSLIKDRDLKAVVIWDEYLAYATSFGIPSKVISAIYESWYNMNITLHFIDGLFKI